MPTEITHHFQNFFVTKLREACSDSATTIYVDTPPEIESGVLCLEYANQTKAEIIYFAGVDGYALTGCVRGMEGTTAQTHSIGADVRQNVTAGMLDQSLNMQCLQSVDGNDQNNPVSQNALKQYLTPSTGLAASKINIKEVANIIYPVGSIYMTATLDTVAKVQNAFGGTWVKWGEGRVPVGVDTSQTEFNTVGKTGGAKTHTLTVTQMPSHKHDGLFFSSAQVTRDGSSGSGAINLNNAWQNVGNGLKASVGNTGGGQAHNNLQPYITCYMYKRTA